MFLALRVQRTQIRSMWGFCIRHRNYGFGYLLSIWVLDPQGINKRRSSSFYARNRGHDFEQLCSVVQYLRPNGNEAPHNFYTGLYKRSLPNMVLVVNGRADRAPANSSGDSTTPRRSMYLYGIYLGLKGVPISLLWSLGMYYNDTWTLWHHANSG